MKISIGNIAGKEIFVDAGQDERKFFLDAIKTRVGEMKIQDGMSAGMMIDTETGMYQVEIHFKKAERFGE